MGVTCSIYFLNPIPFARYEVGGVVLVPANSRFAADSVNFLLDWWRWDPTSKKTRRLMFLSVLIISPSQDLAVLSRTLPMHFMSSSDSEDCLLKRSRKSKKQKYLFSLQEVDR